MQYTGAKGQIPRYACVRGRLDYGEPNCIAFGGLRVDDAVEAALLAVVQPAAVQAALAAEAQATAQRDEAREAMVRDLEAARYAADRAFRQYDAADPENRFVAGELEARWNRALTRVAEIEKRIAEHDAGRASSRPCADLVRRARRRTCRPSGRRRRPTRGSRSASCAPSSTKPSPISTTSTAEIVLTIHWVGGAHTEHRLPRRRRGQRNSTSADIVEAVRTLALIARDDVIAGILNRNGLKTGNGNRWTRERVTSLRSNYRIPVLPRGAGRQSSPGSTSARPPPSSALRRARLRLAAERGEIDAKHPLEDGPWLFSRADSRQSGCRALVL